MPDINPNIATLRGSMRSALLDGREYTEVVFKAVGQARGMNLNHQQLASVINDLRAEGLIPYPTTPTS